MILHVITGIALTTLFVLAVREWRALRCALFLAACQAASAATNTAVSGSFSAVSNAVFLSVDGDTVQIPLGSNGWASCLTVTKAITIQGAGVGLTIIADETDRSVPNSPAVFYLSPPNTGMFRLTGLTIWGDVGLAPNGNGIIQAYTSSTNYLFRIDHVFFDHPRGVGILLNGNIWGVIDHCTLDQSAESSIEILGTADGDAEWADPPCYGTTNMTVIEDCVFNAAAHHGVTDSFHGGKFAVRYCSITNDTITDHGTESGGRSRGVRLHEAYRNVMHDTLGGFAFLSRGGSGVVWSNTMTGFAGFMELINNRSVEPFSPWGAATGVNPWDSNSPTLFDSGNVSAWDTVTTVTDGTKAWTPNEWVGYTLRQENTARASLIYSNSATTLTYNPGFTAWSWTNGQPYEIRLVVAALDQVGRGSGDLVTGDSPSWTPFWPNQISEPLYQWGNLMDGSVAVVNISSVNACIIVNRDYYDGVARPGYTPLVYPHPLVGSTLSRTTVTTLRTTTTTIKGP